VRFALSGWVRNTTSGALLEVEGPAESLDAFQAELLSSPPPLARITHIAASTAEPTGDPAFCIEQSDASVSQCALISPDAAVCEDCLTEMRDPADRRHRYPFINCTNCGPRYTIIYGLPYDRPMTTMSAFDMCPACSAEYHDPQDRRFHAQPNACPACGPHLYIMDANGAPVSVDDPVGATVDWLKAGRIVAVKGLGGFHLAVDATNDRAVRQLRRRKKREEKPLAVMSDSLDRIAGYARVGEGEKRLLTGVQRPIALLEKRRPFPLAPSVAPDNHYIGAMLAYTPLHYLLLEDFTGLVMTSANLSEEPICIENDEALSRLWGIADYFLMHNRDIHLRADDSVVRPGEQGLRQIRRGRGYAPAPIFLRHSGPSVLAVGGEQKNTVCLTKDDRAVLSQHIGDLENLRTLEFFQQAVDHLKAVLDAQPQALACDLHPDYLSAKWARTGRQAPLIEVQHHHAHAAAVMAEHHLTDPVVAVVCDGSGYGTDGCIWGGEILVAEEGSFERRGRLEYTVLPSGAAAVKEPWRMAVSYLEHAYGSAGLDQPLEFLARQDPSQVDLLRQVIHKRLNSPLTSSLGRLFDGAAALLGLRDKAAYEGQAAMLLEMRCAGGQAPPYDHDLSDDGQGIVIHIAPLIRGVVEDLKAGKDAGYISARFHAGVARALSEAAVRVAESNGLKQAVLSGGCFQNQILLAQTTERLTRAGLRVYTANLAPVNDGGLALGQALIARAKAS
jgi:hydrogenase maturation protein HypF